jgi:hypothetical protein
MSADRFSNRIKSVHTNMPLGLDSGSSSDGDRQPLANADQGNDISNRLQALLDIRAQLSEESDSSEGEPLFTENQHLAALFRQRKSGTDNDDILRALGQVVSNSGHKGNSEDNPLQSSEGEDTLDSVHTPTEENHSNTEDEFVPDSPGVTFEHDPRDDVGEVAGDNVAGETLH